MNQEKLSKMMNEYFSLNTQKDELDARLGELRTQILEEMNSDNVKNFENENHIKAAISDKSKITYTDELGIIKYCKENGLGSYIVEKINTTEFNKQLKKSESLRESLNDKFSTESSQALKISL